MLINPLLITGGTKRCGRISGYKKGKKVDGLDWICIPLRGNYGDGNDVNGNANRVHAHPRARTNTLHTANAHIQ